MSNIVDDLVVDVPGRDGKRGGRRSRLQARAPPAQEREHVLTSNNAAY
ncbi:MAG: hypothetical protein IH818_05800 [Acidobacteria bacterium]|nr:hypothetical protein [Acidobacteriota bacterium]